LQLEILHRYQRTIALFAGYLGGATTSHGKLMLPADTRNCENYLVKTGVKTQEGCSLMT
jgi:hypothetical protein